MTTKIAIIYDNPSDPDDFEAGLSAQIDLARAIPGLDHLESAKVWPKEDGSPTPAYRLLDLYFDGYQAASTAVTTAAAGEFIQSVFTLATGGVRIVFAEVENR
jgi:uncharacterized protein (TIGR02118 family)